MVRDLSQNSGLLVQIPKLYSFIVVRKEFFGGYIFNPYQSTPLPMNEIGMRIIESCNGSRTVLEIINNLSIEFSLSVDIMKVTVLDALKAFSEYFAINWRREREAQTPQEETTQTIHYTTKVLSAPLSILWDITYACNLECKHCLVSAGNQLDEEMDLEEIKHIFNQIVEMKVFDVCFLGGEPLMRKDFFQILEYASESNISVTFSTNGMLVDNRVIRRLEDLKVFRVQVSLDGLEETHNALRGVASSYQTAVRAIERLVESGIRVIVSTTVNKTNLYELDELLQLAISLGAASFKVIPFMPTGRGKEVSHLALSQEDAKEYVAAMVERKRKYQDQIHIFIEETYSWLLERPPEPSEVSDFLKGNPCPAGTSQLVISPTGLVYPCPFLHDFPAGNLRQESLSKIWKESKTLKLFREINRDDLKGKCRECPYNPLYCKGGCRAAAYAHTGDLYAEDPMCWFKL